MNANVFKPFLFLLAVVLVVGLACTPTTPAKEDTPPPAQVQPTEVPPVQVQPTTPPQPTAPPPPSAEKFFTENFDGTMDAWDVFQTSGEEGDYDLSVKDGRMVFEMLERQVWLYALYTPQTYRDVRIDVSVENRGDNENNISLLCRYNEDEGWYEFNIANNGLYDILYGKWDTGKRRASYVRIADGGSNRINQGKDVNEYTIICKERTLTLYINGTKTREVDDNQFVLRDGMIGISASSFRRLPVKVEYDWVKISEP